MSPYINDMENPASESLAASHFGNRWITDNQCYACHAQPGLVGFADAKIRGLRHSYAYYLGDADAGLAVYSPYSNDNCLGCHEAARSYEEEVVHELVADEISSDETSCMDSGCHGSVHPDGLDTETMRARTALNAMAKEEAPTKEDG
jgi:hypothetical protein